MPQQVTTHNQDPNSRAITIPHQGTNEEFTLRVLTLNCWGLWFGAKKRLERIAGIIRYLQESNCDVVFLQEIWVTSDFEAIRSGTKNIYRFAHLYRSGSVLGSSGVVILSKWSPKVVHFEPYSLNGTPFHPWHGDWFAGKGIAYSRVDFEGLALHLFSTHTHAYYKENEPIQDQYSVHRMCQSYQLANFINFISDTACNRKSDGKDLFIVAGDMNTTSSELPYKILTTVAGLTDCFKQSRYNNLSSNIIHKHKLTNCKSNSHNQDDASNSSSFSQGDSGSYPRDAYSLQTMGEHKNKTTQVAFDSDTEDEDVTYCHPRNSFTPGFEYKQFKSGSISSNPSTKSSSQRESLTKTATNDENSSIEKSNSGQSSIIMGQGKANKSQMRRIDFILCRLLTHGHCVVDRIVTNYEDPKLKCSLSDHEPVMIEMKISDVSHDLIKKNHIVNQNAQNKSNSSKQSRPLVSVVESKIPMNESSEVEETTDRWMPEKGPTGLSLTDCNIKVMETTLDILVQYYKQNRRSKKQLLCIVLFMFLITLPTATYYAITNDLIPISTIVLIWLAVSTLFAIGLLVGFLNYRYEQKAIEAIVNDIKGKISVAQDHDLRDKDHHRY